MGSGHSIYWTNRLDQPQARFVANAVRGTRGEEPPSPCRFGVATLALPHMYHRKDYRTMRNTGLPHTKEYQATDRLP